VVWESEGTLLAPPMQRRTSIPAKYPACMLTLVTTTIRIVDEALLVCVVATPNARSAAARVAGNNTTNLKRCANNAPTARPTMGSQIIFIAFKHQSAGRVLFRG
jgi:hypothetical protein